MVYPQSNTGYILWHGWNVNLTSWKWPMTGAEHMGLTWKNILNIWVEAAQQADGLEVLLTSIAINTHINVVFEDCVWATGTEGVNFSYPTIVFTTAGALPCKVFDSKDGNYVDMDTTGTTDSPVEEHLIPASLQVCSGGQPLMSVQTVPPLFDTTSSDTDPDNKLRVELPRLDHHWTITSQFLVRSKHTSWNYFCLFIVDKEVVYPSKPNISSHPPVFPLSINWVDHPGPVGGPVLDNIFTRLYESRTITLGR